jgi:tRNA(Met) cytidine acetyltransferase
MSDLPDGDHGHARLAALTVRIAEHAAAARQRRAVVIAGTPEWTIRAAETCLRATGGCELWLSDRPLERDQLSLSSGTKLLGRELGCLVYDAHGGFDPDAFGAASGSLRGGGLLFLLTPPLALWPTLTDPQAARLAVGPYVPAQVSGRFIARLAKVLGQDGRVVLIRQGHRVPDPPPDNVTAPHPAPKPDTDGCRSRDQGEAVQAILRTAGGRVRRPLILTSDRGRGKSSALGLAAARLLETGQVRILVTAPRRSAVDPVFQHAARLLPHARLSPNRLLLPEGVLQFLPPDDLARGPQPADLLLVDEAAGIPAPLLAQLLALYPRVVFATTVHGYEGTGRGFQVRFRHILEQRTSGHRSLELRTPIRWAPDDPLETLVGRALLLDAQPAADEELEGASPADCSCEAPDRDRLLEQEQTLSELFGLLVLAHYRTRPMDLRHLLDGPNIQVHLVRYRRRVAATALVALEGRLDAQLAGDIYDGRRRPRGHLLPQTLAAHAGLADAPLLGCARIVRIAVHPAVRGRGLARMLLQRITDRAQRQGMDLVGSSFGATPDLLRFWAACGFPSVHLGTSRNAASGCHAAVVLHPLTRAGEDLTTRGRQRFSERFPDLLAGPFRRLEPEVAATLLSTNEPAVDATAPALDWRELRSFSFAKRPFEAALPGINALLRRELPSALRENLLHQREYTLLIARVMQYRDWAETARLVCATGRAEVTEALRRAVGRLIHALGPEEGEESAGSPADSINSNALPSGSLQNRARRPERL